MSDETHEENATPGGATDEQVIGGLDGGVFDNTGQGDARPGESVDEGAGASPDPSDTEHTDDPKGSQRPV
jgi:hypothetical protein